MAQLLIQSLGCPNCGAPFDPKESRNCKYCGSVLIITSVKDAFDHELVHLDLSASIEKWRQLLKDNPEDAKAHFALGIVYLNSKFRDSALEHFRRAVVLQPEAPDTHYNLAVTLFNDGNLALNSPEYAEMVKEIDYSVRLSPDFKEAQAFSHVFIARKLDSIDYKQAYIEYRKAIEYCPNIGVFWNNLGLCYHKDKNFKEAYKTYQHALTLNPKLGITYSNMALVLFEQGNYQSGIEMGEKALSLMGPGELPILQAEAHNSLALCLWKSNRKAEALVHSKTAVALAPNFPIFKQNLNKIQGKGCFVVTATVGDHFHPWVVELSTFRDQILTQSEMGRWLVNFYYKVSPFLAQIIASSATLRWCSRFIIVVPSLTIARIWTTMHKSVNQ